MVKLFHQEFILVERTQKMVGLSDQMSEIRDELTSGSLDFVFPAFSLVGMPGIGKTTLAKEIFNDPLIFSNFDCRAWVTMGRKCQLNEIPRAILGQVDADKYNKMLKKGDEAIIHQLQKSLKGKRYLIVLDDVWDINYWFYLTCFLPPKQGRSAILLTTRLQEVAQLDCGNSIPRILKLRLLNKEESWDLLREKVFGEESTIPPQLEKAGKKIAENCEGLPLMIVTVADLLSKVEKTPEYWNKLAEKENSLFMDAYKEISEVLLPSYEYLPQFLKGCFLYMGVFPKKYEIPKSMLIQMWIAEGFLEPNKIQTLEECATKCLELLVSNSLVIVYQDNTILTDSGIKTCGLHSSLWHLCNREAGKNKFFHVLNSCADGLADCIKSQRRLCIHNNILLGIKDVNSSVEDNCASTARSLLCFGSYHQYPVPICFSLRLLKELHALTIRFYEFPMEVLKLVQLRYLALTSNGKLPASISKLWKLQFLIVRQHQSIKFCGAPSYLPKEIWNMQELKHLQIMGSNLLVVPNCGAPLQNLLTLLDVSAHSCTKGVLERIANLKKLGIRIELALDAAEPLCCFDHISHLEKLESLKCVIVNPELRSEVVAPPATLSIFPSSLRKLTLSGLGYPWEYMSIIGSLPNLEVLKLGCYAFRGPKWEIKRGEFPSLMFLVIEDTDLVQWKIGCEGFPWLDRLSIKHCYKLEELHWESHIFPEKIEIVDCNSLVTTCVKQIKLRIRPFHNYVSVHSSWEDGKLKS